MNEDKGTRYRRAERRLRLIEAIGAGVALVSLALTPLPAYLHEWVSGALRPTSPLTTLIVETLAAAVVLVTCIAVSLLAAAPAALQRGNVLARRYRMPAVSTSAHVGDRVRRGLLLVLAGSLAWCVFARLAAVTPWLAGIGLALVLLMLVSLVALLAPWVMLLSPRVRPLRDEAVAGRLHAMASRANLRLAGLHEWVLGQHGDQANAALVGVIGPRRLLISDTLITGCPPEEMDAVVAHELGHHAHGHTWQRARAQAATLLAAALGAQACAAGPARWLGGTQGLTDPASVPWMLIGAGAVWVAARPWLLAQSRAHEVEADAFALRLTGRPDVLERVLARLGERNLSSDDDSPLTRAFFLTHPPIAARIAAARRAAGASRVTQG